MALDLWDCLGRVKLIEKIHRTDLVISCHSREEKACLIADKIWYPKMGESVGLSNGRCIIMTV